MHVQRCVECNGDFSACAPSGGENGAGVPNADFVLYVSAIDDPACTNNVLAFAGACELEQTLDRFVLALNLCMMYVIMIDC